MTDEAPPGPAPDRAGVLGVAIAHAEALVGATGDAVGWGAATSADLTRRAVVAGVRELSRFGRLVLRAWQAFERLSNPPWTLQKALVWAAIFLSVSVVTLVAYEVRYGLLTLPMVADAGLGFVAWLASLGPVGLFAFTVVGTLFFMIIPTEPFFFIMLAGDGSVAAAVLAAALGSTAGSCINYWFGNRLRVSAGKKRPGQERQLGTWGKRANSRSGTALLFAASALPLPELVGVAYGVVDYPFRRFALVAGAGRLIKWSWIAAAYLAVGFTL